MKFSIFIIDKATDLEKGVGHALNFTVSEWDASGYTKPEEQVLLDHEVRRFIMQIALPCRDALSSVLLEHIPLASIVGRATHYKYEDATISVVYDCNGTLKQSFLPAEVFPALTCPAGLLPVPTTSSHFGAIPLFPPLQVLCAARPFFTGFCLKRIKPLGDFLRKVREGGGSSWHYSRFAWEPAAKGWCDTYLFYSSHIKTGPLMLYPMKEDSTLNSKEKEFDLHYVKCVLNDEDNDVSREIDGAVEGGSDDVRGGGCLTVLDMGEGLVEEISKGLLLNDGWEGFAGVCEAHGFARPTAKMLLDVGLEKALILLCHFFPIAPNVGFAYSHTFSAVPEPATLCLVSSAASTLFTVSINSTEGKEMLQFVQSAWKDTQDNSTAMSLKEVRNNLDSISDENLAQLAACRSVKNEADSVLDFMEKTLNPNLVKYCAERGITVG